MSRFVVDASVAIKWVVAEPGSGDASLLRRAQALIAPDLIVAELANILWKKVTRGELPVDQALLAADLLERSGLDLRGMGRLLASATRLAIALGHPAYDCVYLALAMEEGCPFVTADEKLIRRLASATTVTVSALSIREAALLVGR